VSSSDGMGSSLEGKKKKVKLDIRAKEEPESGGCDDWLVEKVDTKRGGGSRSSLLFLGY